MYGIAGIHYGQAVDSSVLVKQGDAGLARLNGLFALCVRNDHDGWFLLARDRFGAKPEALEINLRAPLLSPSLSVSEWMQ